MTLWLTYRAVKLIFSFVLSYPFAGLLKRIPDSKPAYKNYFIIGYLKPFLYSHALY